MAYQLNKPYTETQKADFICLHQGLKPVETDTAFYFLENHEELQNGEIVDVSNTQEYQTKIQNKQNESRKNELTFQIKELDLKRIRAGFEPSVKDETTGETYLEYYTKQIINLREELNLL